MTMVLLILKKEDEFALFNEPLSNNSKYSKDMKDNHLSIKKKIKVKLILISKSEL